MRYFWEITLTRGRPLQLIGRQINKQADTIPVKGCNYSLQPPDVDLQQKTKNKKNPDKDVGLGV